MTKEEVFQILKNTIKHIDHHFCSEDRDNYLDIPLKDANLPFQYSIDSGISKAVILIKGADFVIKIPFLTFFDEDYYDCCLQDNEQEVSDAIDAYIAKLGVEDYILSKEELAQVRASCSAEPQAEDFYYELEGASNINLGPDIEPAIPDWDYCRLESVIYQLAVEEGLGAYFAEEAYLGTIADQPVYYQTRCIPKDDSYKITKEKARTTRHRCEELNVDCFDPGWIADFIDCYGEEELKRLNDFLYRYEITDLRPGNIGYLDGAPILFDYSGYRDW